MKMKKKNTSINNLIVIKAPKKLTNGGITVFLAGSIEMGKAVDWQTQIENELKDKLDGDTVVTLYNPRRDDWDCVDVTCRKYKVPMVDDIDGLVKFILDE